MNHEPTTAGSRLHQALPTNDFVAFSREQLEQAIPDRFEQQVEAYPDQIALRTKYHTLTYDEINQRANRVARAILARRGSEQEPIVLLLENDAPMLTAMLAVLKANKIYVPLDVSMPRSRMEYVLDDSQTALLITNNENLHLAQGLSRGAVEVLNIDDIDSGSSNENPRVTASPDAYCWILYTSGSTGQPKGVVQTHRNIIHYVRRYTNSLHLSAADRLSLFFSFSFNGGNHEIFSALLNGASLFALDIRKEGLGHLADWVNENGLTIYCSVPTLFRHFLSSLPSTVKFPSIRLIKLIGEPVYRRDVELYKKHFADDCILVNRLGATELGTVRWNFINKQTPMDSRLVPVGYAVEDNEILLLDEDRTPVGINEIGEIAVKSRYISPGYWRKPDRTKTVFLPDPDGGEARMYLTGDLGLMRPDGCLVHHGRKDFQAKIRGHRVEIGEVETALAELETVEEAVVLAQSDDLGDQRLIAYLVPARHLPPDVSTLRRELEKTLPSYMIPSLFVLLEKMPLTTSGKVNRLALPAPDGSRPPQEAAFVSPRTPLEVQLAEIWAAVLGIEQIGIQDNLLDLGGDSLRAAQILVRLQNALGVEVPLRSLWESPTVAALAEEVERSSGYHPAGRGFSEKQSAAGEAE